MKKKKIIVGNWKMNPASLEEALSLFSSTDFSLKKSPRVEAVICPPFVFIEPLLAEKSKKISIGAQNIFYESAGSYTGEVSAMMLKNSNVSYCIVGHSERRKLGETDEIVNKKVHQALQAGIIPIVCVGERVRDDEGNFLAEIKEQLQKSIAGVERRHLKSIIIAYEPVFAVGAAQALDPHAIHEMMILIKKILIETYKIKAPIETPILYGGAVDTENTRSILSDGEADGLLIGRQSLDAQTFTSIIKIAQAL